MQAHAAAAGLTQGEWLTALIERAVTQPAVKVTYKIRALGPNSAHASIVRDRGGLGPGGASNMSQDQADAYKKAKLLIGRNEAGDRERAIGLLSAVFEEVFEL